MSRKWRGALVGCGFFGKIQAEAWQRMDDVELVAACDADIHCASAFSSRAYSSVAELLEKETIDFVDIATRPDSHLELVRRTTARGIPTICQKPMAATLAKAVEMASLAASARLMIHENWRWQPWYRAAKVMIAAGSIGKPVSYHFRIRQRDGLGPTAYPNQPYFRQMPRLLIHETLIHPIDTGRYLFGNIHSVYAHARRHNPMIKGEDKAVVVVIHDANLDGLIDGHRFLNPEPPGAAMGDAWFDGEDASMHIGATGDITIQGEVVWAAPLCEGYKGDSVFAAQRHFLDCLASGADFETDARDYLRSFAATEAAYVSIAEHREVALSELVPE